MRTHMKIKRTCVCYPSFRSSAPPQSPLILKPSICSVSSDLQKAVNTLEKSKTNKCSHKRNGTSLFTISFFIGYIGRMVTCLGIYTEKTFLKANGHTS